MLWETIIIDGNNGDDANVFPLKKTLTCGEGGEGLLYVLLHAGADVLRARAGAVTASA